MKKYDNFDNTETLKEKLKSKLLLSATESLEGVKKKYFSERHNKFNFGKGKQENQHAKSIYPIKKDKSYERDTSETTKRSHKMMIFNNRFKSGIEKVKAEEEEELENMMIFDEDEFSKNNMEEDDVGNILHPKAPEENFQGFEEIISYLSEKESKIEQKKDLNEQLEFKDFTKFECASKDDQDTTQADFKNT